MLYEQTCADLDLQPMYTFEEEVQNFLETCEDITMLSENVVIDKLKEIYKKIKDALIRFWNWITGKKAEAVKDAEKVVSETKAKVAAVKQAVQKEEQAAETTEAKAKVGEKKESVAKAEKALTQVEAVGIMIPNLAALESLVARFIADVNAAIADPAKGFDVKYMAAEFEKIKSSEKDTPIGNARNLAEKAHEKIQSAFKGAIDKLGGKINAAGDNATETHVLQAALGATNHWATQVDSLITSVLLKSVSKHKAACSAVMSILHGQEPKKSIFEM